MKSRSALAGSQKAEAHSVDGGEPLARRREAELVSLNESSTSTRSLGAKEVVVEVAVEAAAASHRACQ